MKLFIFGSTGDLVRRKIVPAFVALNIKDLEIIALGRKEFTDKMYQDFVCDDDCFQNFETKPKYQKIEFGNEIVCEKCDQYLVKGEEHFFYSALPPKQLKNLISYVGGIKRGGYDVKVLVEKPFGYSRTNALELKSLVEKNVLVNELFVSDHYLYKKEIASLSPQPFKKLKIVSLESVGLEKRAGYYDEIGAVKDMVQSHFINVALKLNPSLLFSVDTINVSKFSVGQYGNGIDLGYAGELGRKSETETFAHIVFSMGEQHFEFITGKRFDKKVGFLEIDGVRVNFGASGKDYEDMFLDFFAKKYDKFATIDQSIAGWEITERLLSFKSDLKFYKEGESTESVLKGENIFSQ